MDAIYCIDISTSDVELYHYGTKGQKWGYRRWQNPDGSLTAAGKEHYGRGLAGKVKNVKEKRIQKSYARASKQKDSLDAADKVVRDNNKKLKKASDEYANATKRTEVAKYDHDKAVEKGKSSLFGNKRNIKKTNQRLIIATNKESVAKRAFEDANNELSRAEVNQTKIKDIYNKYRNKADKQASRYIKKYTAVSMKELMDANNEFKKNVTNVESGQKYTHYDEVYYN